MEARMGLTFFEVFAIYTAHIVDVHVKLVKLGVYKTEKVRGQPELNRWPLDLQSNALPLSYTPNADLSSFKFGHNMRLQHTPVNIMLLRPTSSTLG